MTIWLKYVIFLWTFSPKFQELPPTFSWNFFESWSVVPRSSIFSKYIHTFLEWEKTNLVHILAIDGTPCILTSIVMPNVGKITRKYPYHSSRQWFIHKNQRTSNVVLAFPLKTGAHFLNSITKRRLLERLLSPVKPTWRVNRWKGIWDVAGAACRPSARKKFLDKVTSSLRYNTQS